MDAINTVQFSNHTGYGRWGGVRFDAEHLQDVFQAIKANGLLRHERMLTGYTPSPEALASVESMVQALREQSPSLVYLLDPVMGDMDRGMYVNPDVLPIYRRMLALATIICPNQFEAQVLAAQEITSLATLRQVLHKLHTEYGVPNVVITSLALPDADLKALGLALTLPSGEEAMLLVGSSLDDTHGERAWMMQFPTKGEYYTGVGDLFSALVLARYAPTAASVPPPAQYAAPSDEHADACDAHPVARSVMLAVATLQQVLECTRASMTAAGEALGVDVFQPAHLADLDTRVQIMRLRELRIIPSADAILHPTVQHRPTWLRWDAL